jgi:hypothetical protein
MYAKSGSFTGTGSSQTISGLPFQPDAVFVKVGGASNADTWFITKDMPATFSFPVRSDLASATNRITAITSTGFSVGTDNAVNQNTLPVFWLALKDDGTGDFSTVSYTGDNTDDKLIFTAFKPDWSILKSNSTIVGAQKFAPQASALASPTTSNYASMHFQSGPDRSDLIGFFSDGMRVSNGSSSGGNLINVNAVTHYGVALKNSANFLSSSYTGTGSAQTISTSFAPIFINLHATTSQPPVMQYQAAQAANTTNPFDGAQSTGKITSTTSTGFTLGTDASVNQSGTSYWYMVIGQKVPSTKTSNFFAMF